MSSGAGPARVVLCDDVPQLRTLLRFGLEEDGTLRVVAEAGDAPTGIALVAEHRPDALLLDLSMPGMDGLQAIPAAREHLPRLAIVVFSGFGADRVAPTALGLGADRYLEKGTEMTVLRATLLDAIAERRDGAATRDRRVG